ncbi:hypothetical protein [Catellatospora tritici]|uniref:hypothetical protein n=1 Tax=Catellatospora tritici TaxID=2851566 RepID=UPI001C2DE2FC|nr:hypothetical protein [Catellatospora tritici]MBV1848520.1 hypothetical protein [Catellatospora tritici]MBV1851460.1 hypothetical protein [Catellatospora tritici]
MRTTLRSLALLVLLAGLPLTGPSPALAAPPDGVKGTAEGVIRRADGHVDSARTVSRLVELHANTYMYLVRAATDWDDLRLEFMPAAQANGVRVIVYLLPPTECPSSAASPYSCDTYLPHHKDYVAWGQDIATLSNQYPLLTAWTIDDMDMGSRSYFYNPDFFTPAYVRQMNVAASAIQPHLDFYLEYYQPSLTQTVINSYEYAIDGVIMPYRDGVNRNTTMTDTEQAAIDSVSAMLAAQGKRLILMVYGNELSATVDRPDVDYLTRAVDTALADTSAGKIAGVIIWQLVLDPAGAPAGGSFRKANTGSGALSLSVAPGTETAAGQYAQAKADVTFTPAQPCTLSLRYADDRNIGQDLGYHDKQILVRDETTGTQTIIWRRDVASENTTWDQWEWTSTLDLRPYLVSGHRISLILRLAELKKVSNYSVNVAYDDLAFSGGCGVSNTTFESDAGWTVSRSGGPVLAGVYQYSSTYTTDAFAAVAGRF